MNGKLMITLTINFNDNANGLQMVRHQWNIRHFIAYN